MRRVTLAILALGLAWSATAAEAQTPKQRLASARSFAFALGSGTLDGDVTERLAPFDLVVVDGQEVTRAQVRALRARGKLVLAYVSVGTIEPGRPWYRRARRFRLDAYEEFDEYYADTSRAGYRRLLARRVTPPMLAKGFDGLFLDNVDMIEDHPRQARGMRMLVRDLARVTHGRRRLLFAQNGDRVIGPSVRYLDGWNREDVTSTYDFRRRRYVAVSARDTRAAQATLRRLARRGLTVTAADYTGAGDRAMEAAAVRNACLAGALPFVSNIGLTRIPPQPFVCLASAPAG